MFSQRQVYVLYSIDFCSRILIPKVFGQCGEVDLFINYSEAADRNPIKEGELWLKALLFLVCLKIKIFEEAHLLVSVFLKLLELSEIFLPLLPQLNEFFFYYCTLSSPQNASNNLHEHASVSLYRRYKYKYAARFHHVSL